MHQQAESIAYVVCRHFGFGTTARSSVYIALWQGDFKALRASMERIASTARTIIDTWKRYFPGFPQIELTYVVPLESLRCGGAYLEGLMEGKQRRSQK